MTPLVSIIIRTEGLRPNLLRRALNSALQQSWAALEVIVVEDGGVSLADTLPQGVRHLPLAKCGRSAAGNAGLQMANGEFATFLDDDDWLLSHHVALLAKALTDAPHAAAAYGLTEEVHVTAQGREVNRRAARHLPFSRARLWQGNFLPIQSVLFRKSLFTGQGGFDPALDALEDWDLWLRYSLHAPFVAVPQITSAYTLPASKAALRARAKAHCAAMERVRAKHAATQATFTFAEIGELEAQFRARLDDFAGARWCLGRLWRRLRSGR